MANCATVAVTPRCSSHTAWQMTRKLASRVSPSRVSPRNVVGEICPGRSFAWNDMSSDIPPFSLCSENSEQPHEVCDQMERNNIPRYHIFNTHASHAGSANKKVQLAPFQTRLLKEASTPEQLRALLAASYRTGPDDADLSPARPDDLGYLEKELGLGRLSKLSTKLWVAGRPLPPRPLHYQRLLGREIVIAERMDLHLVWSTGRIYMKPIPRFLLEPNFWSRYLLCYGQNCTETTTTACQYPRLWKCALGFLFSYAALICYESDFLIAKEKHLLPDEVEWADWRRLVAEIGVQHIYKHVDIRFHYGELRLSRLDKLQYLASGMSLRAYMPHWNRYEDFFRDQFAWLASTAVYIAVVLAAMQVGLATRYLADNDAFQAASYAFTMFAILGPLVALGLILTIFFFVFIWNWLATLVFRNRRLAYIRSFKI